MIVIVKQEKRIDEIVFEYYGNLDHLDEVIELNPHLYQKVVLDLGDKIKLPEFQKKEKIANIKGLWD